MCTTAVAPKTPEASGSRVDEIVSPITPEFLEKFAREEKLIFFRKNYNLIEYRTVWLPVGRDGAKLLDLFPALGITPKQAAAAFSNGSNENPASYRELGDMPGGPHGIWELAKLLGKTIEVWYEQASPLDRFARFRVSPEGLVDLPYILPWKLAWVDKGERTDAYKLLEFFQYRRYRFWVQTTPGVGEVAREVGVADRRPIASADDPGASSPQLFRVEGGKVQLRYALEWEPEGLSFVYGQEHWVDVLDISAGEIQNAFTKEGRQLVLPG